MIMFLVRSGFLAGGAAHKAMSPSSPSPGARRSQRGLAARRLHRPEVARKAMAKTRAYAIINFIILI